MRPIPKRSANRPKKISQRTQALINAIVLRNLKRLDITPAQRAAIAMVLLAAKRTA
jgi:hypothetical protein